MREKLTEKGRQTLRCRNWRGLKPVFQLLERADFEIMETRYQLDVVSIYAVGLPDARLTIELDLKDIARVKSETCDIL